MTTKEFSTLLQNKLTSEYGVDLSVASNQQIYRALALICRQMMSDNYKKFQSKVIGTGSKQVYYLCMEFLMGRSLKVSLLNLGLDEVCKAALAAADINVDTIYEEEPDAGLGNGGLGRLAACYLDGMATTCIGGTGYSILYEYGIFKQKIVDGWQQERADNWLPGGQVWLKGHPDQAVEVRLVEDGRLDETELVGTAVAPAVEIGPHGRVHDGIEPGYPVGVAEGPRGQQRAVQGAAGIDVVAKGFGYLPFQFGRGVHQAPGLRIGIVHAIAHHPQQVRDNRLAAAYAACNSYSFHIVSGMETSTVSDDTVKTGLFCSRI